MNKYIYNHKNITNVNDFFFNEVPKSIYNYIEFIFIEYNYILFIFYYIIILYSI